MLTLFIRTIVLYIFVFLAIRLSGKRQLSELQPFDLVVTLLIADLAAAPATDTGMPLMYGIVPIMGLFFMQHIVAFLSLKLEWFRHGVCGRPIVMISGGRVQENSMKDAHYTLNDLMEQLRSRGVFDLTTVECAILETDGQLSVMLKGPEQPLTFGAAAAENRQRKPAVLIVQDGKVQPEALKQAGRDENWLKSRLPAAGVKSCDQLLIALVNGETLHMQAKAGAGGKIASVNIEGGE